MPPVIIVKGGPSAAPSVTTTVITTSQTFTANGSGVYRVLCVPSGATGQHYSELGSCGGGGSGPPCYGEIELGDGQAVAVVVGESANGIFNGPGNPGNRSRFGSYVQGVSGAVPRSNFGGDGWAGGGSGGGNGGTLGLPGVGSGTEGRGLGLGLLIWLNTRFVGASLTSGVPGTGFAGNGGGGAGLLINGLGPSGSTTRGSGYGGGSNGLANSGSFSGSSNPGVVVVEGPY